MKKLLRTYPAVGSVFALAALSSSSAWAQAEGDTCESEVDCGDGLTCVYGDFAGGGTVGGMTSGGMAPAGTTMTEPAENLGFPAAGGAASSDTKVPPAAGGESTGAPTMQTFTGTCTAVEGACSTDDDCEADSHCSNSDFAVSTPAVMCAPDMDCVQPDPIDPSIYEGSCVVNPLTCTDDPEACPSPTTCGDDGFCKYEPTDCESDDECDSGYECAVTSSYGECSGCTGMAMAGTSTAPAGRPAPGTGSGNTTMGSTTTGGMVATGGATNEDGIPEQPAEVIDGGVAPETCETVCTTVEVHSCTPKPAPCEADSDCDGDWTCFDIPEDAALTEAFEGVDKTCLPPGLVAVAEGRVQGSYSANSLGMGVTESGVAGGMSATGTAAGGPIDPSVPGTDPGAGDGDTAMGPTATTGNPSDTAGDGTETGAGEGSNPVRGTQSGGCSVGSAPQSPARSSWLFALGALALGMTRLRRRS